MNSIEDAKLFRSAVGIALEEWDSLQACIEHGMGGDQVHEKVEWMINVVTKYFNDTKSSFDFREAVDYVEQIMDNEFDTLIEDESTELLIRNIERFFSLSNQQKYDELRGILNEKAAKLSATKEARKQRRQENKLNEDLEELEMSDNDESASDEEDGQAEPKKDNRATTDEDGWTKF